jgi:hypothetical protein
MRPTSQWRIDSQFFVVFLVFACTYVIFNSFNMSIPSSSTISTLIDDDLSMMVHDSSQTTLDTHTTTSWHSVVSDVPLNNHLFIRSPAINIWLAHCLIEPDIRLTNAQEWKLRTCLRRFLVLCNHPLRLVCVSWSMIHVHEMILIVYSRYAATFVNEFIGHVIDRT